MTNEKSPREGMTVAEAGRKGGQVKSKAKRDATNISLARARAKRLELIQKKKSAA